MSRRLIKKNNKELTYRLKVNYNNVHSHLRMALGRKAYFFADISPKSTETSWFADDDAQYISLSDAPKQEVNALTAALNDDVSEVRRKLLESRTLSPYVDEIMEIPDNSFVFYRMATDGWKFILTGWGCNYSNSGNANMESVLKKGANTPVVPDPTEPPKPWPVMPDIPEPAKPEPPKPEPVPDIPEPPKPELPKPEPVSDIPNLSNPEPPKPEPVPDIPEPSKPEPKIKTQNVIVRVLDQNNNPLVGEVVNVRTSKGEVMTVTSDSGDAFVGELPYDDSFGISFPNIAGNKEKTFEVEPNVEIYEAYVKKLHNYSPVLYVEDNDGNAVTNHNVRVIIGGADTLYNSGGSGVIQLPPIQEGQMFVVIDTANYANTEEFKVTKEDAKKPYRFHVSAPRKAKVGITVLDKSGKPISGVNVSLVVRDKQSSRVTAEDGRAEFPSGVFVEGVIPVTLWIHGKGKIEVDLNFNSDQTEYTIQLQSKPRPTPRFNWKWLALLPLLLLLGCVGYALYKYLPKHTPTVKELERGVVLVKADYVYYVETELYVDGKPWRYYFQYDENSKKYGKGTFDENKINEIAMLSTGTGFLISKDGLIATNRHVADPIPPEDARQRVKVMIQADMDTLMLLKEALSRELSRLNRLSRNSDGYTDAIKKAEESQLKVQKYIENYQKILNIGEFTVKVDCKTSVAFVESIIEEWDDFVGCSLRGKGEPGGVTENDVAIIQLKNKDRDVPKDAFIFKVPEKDLMDAEIPDDYDITVLGYNKGLALADIQKGIHPQAQPGKITVKEKYRIGYNASTLGGSSGSPVYNKKGQLVAINNSGVANTQGFNFGVRTKYLRKLLDEILGTEEKK